ncbi:hypothetical protein XarzCFBP7410_16430 [Xanthomonas arboricola pv. zantedeschiae]|nr:hypothetical protein XarbCFBP7629_08585 [Xanthomonas arboricola]PPT82388.1 hypothetical protein XarzCFBP7410_16430 [Xanthomonas arboricola pv. zantedeschiae]
MIAQWATHARWLGLAWAAALCGCGAPSPPAPMHNDTPAQATSAAGADSHAAVASASGNSAAASYARAQRYARCALIAETSQPMRDGIELDDIDRLGDAATAGAGNRLDPQALQRAACRHVGAGEYAQVDQLLRQSAAAGNVDAQIELLRRRASAVLERQAPAVADGLFAPPSASDHAEADQVLAALEDLAMRGHRAAMPVLDQLLSSPLPGTAEPLYGDAWRLVAEQPFGRPLPAAQPLRGEAMFEDMDAHTEQQVVALARELHAHCCAGQGAGQRE